MNEQQEDLIKKWLAGAASEEEVLKTISKEELQQYKTILHTVDNWEPKGSEAFTSQLEEILATPKEAKVVSMKQNTSWFIRIAASIALIATIAFIFFNDQGTVYYADNNTLEVILPDKTTKVVLSPGAKLSFDDFDPENREVEIEGRAYFDVTEKGPFQVSYEKGSISVLGTQFEIVQLKDFFEASCYEGSVKVAYAGEEATMIRGERVNYANGSLPKTELNLLQPGWIQGSETFENALLEKVIKVIETRYKVTIDVENISLDRRFSGTITTDNLDSACKAVFSTLGINYQIQNKTIILSE